MVGDGNSQTRCWSSKGRGEQHFTREKFTTQVLLYITCTPLCTHKSSSITNNPVGNTPEVLMGVESGFNPTSPRSCPGLESEKLLDHRRTVVVQL